MVGCKEEAAFFGEVFLAGNFDAENEFADDSPEGPACVVEYFHFISLSELSNGLKKRENGVVRKGGGGVAE